MASPYMSNSFLQMTVYGTRYHAKVLSFSGDIVSNINSVQTQRMQQHFPFKVSQPTLSMTLQMRNQLEAEYFQVLGRLSQATAWANAETVNFFWPQRGMMDWRGVILSVQAGDKVGQTSPVIMIEILLTDNMVSERTWGSSSGTEFEQIYAGEIPDIPLIEPSRRTQPPGTFTDNLTPPRPPTNEGKPTQGPYQGPDGRRN